MPSYQRVCEGGKDFEIGVVEEFGMTNGAQHFGEDLTSVDRVVGVFHLDGTFTSILLAFGLVESFRLRLTGVVNGGGLLREQFRSKNNPMLLMLNRYRREGLFAVPHLYGRQFFPALS
jgi:hypothetical protein